MKKGVKVFGLIAILIIVGSVFVGVVSAQDITIDTEIGESGFMTYPSRPDVGWVHVHDHDTFDTNAYNGNYWYTLCGEEGHGDPLYYGLWQANLPQSGNYEVFVWIPNPEPFAEDWPPYRVYTTTQNAIYQIYHEDGMTTKTVNQGLRTGDFYSLGAYNFDTTASVILNDRTGEPYLSRMIAFDAINFVPVSVHDMAVANVYTTPSSPNAGQSTTIYVTIKNEGNQQENSVPVKAYVDGVQKGSTQYVTLSAGQSTTKSFSWTPSTAKTYSAKGEVGVVSGETDTTDNSKTKSVTVNPAPVHDMAVANVYTTPSSPNVGQSTTIYVTVKNEGSQQENSVLVKAYVDGSQVGSTQYVTLSASQSTTKSFPWTPGTAKTYSVKGEVGVVSGESDTSDNSKTISVGVNPAPVHDMAVTNVYTTPSSPNVGQSTTSYVTVKNEGNQQENSVPVKAYVDGVQKGSTQYVTLSTDQSTTKSFSWTPATAKTYSVKGEVGIVSGETDTTDNSKTKSVTVNPASVHDMAVTDVYTTPSSPFVGQSTTIYVTVKNEGDQQENSVPVKAYVDGAQVGSTQYVSLSPDSSDTKSFSWTHSTAKTYSVKGEVGIVSGETDTTDNSKTKSVTVQQQNQPVITSPLEITPWYVVYVPGEVTTAQFTITNKGTVPIVFKVLTVGGRDPDGEVVDFDWQKDITLNPEASQNYIGNLILPEKTGTYHFFCTYQTEDGNWNTCVDLTPGLTDDDRAKRISIVETVIGPPTEFAFEAAHLSSEDYEDLSNIAKEILTQEKSKLDADDQKLALINPAIVQAHRIETNQGPPRDLIREGALTESQDFWLTGVGGNIVGFLTGLPLVGEWAKQLGFDIAEVLYMKDLGFVRMKQSSIGDLTITYREDSEGTLINYQNSLGGFFITSPVKSKWVFSPISLLRKQLYLPDLESYSIIYKENCDITAQIKSPGELRVYDSENRVTGLVNGEVKEEIQNSMYDKNNNTVAILFAHSDYGYGVVGTNTGTYGLEITSVDEENVTDFSATEIPTLPNATHEYTVNWTALSQGGAGVTLKIDADGDGEFEETLTIQPPIANLTYTPKNPVINQTITFDASDSIDLDGNITSYKWDFGDETNGTGEITAHSYSSAGNYIVTLTVRDEDGATTSTSKTVNIPNHSPCFIATAAYGTPLHEDIDVLRDFRDEYLMMNPIGRTFVKIYYTTSPPIAEVIRENEGLRTIVREGLVKPLVYISRMFVG